MLRRPTSATPPRTEKCLRTQSWLLGTQKNVMFAPKRFFVVKTMKTFLGFLKPSSCFVDFFQCIGVSQLQRFTSSSRHSSKCYSPALKAKEPGKKRDNFQSFLMMTLCTEKKTRENWEMLSILSNFRDTLIEMLPS